MNNRARFNRLIALLILVATAMTMVSCENLPFDIEGIFHSHSFVDGKCECGETDPDYVHEHYYANGVCVYCGEKKPEDNPPPHEHNFVDGKCECGQELIVPPELQTITIAEALEIAAANPAGTTEHYYIRATVKTIKNASYGEMIIEDATGEIYVYGTRGEDGTTYFDKLPERPVKGDEVLLLCQLSQYEGESQVKLARLIEFKHVEVDLGDLTAYEEMTIAEAREADSDKLVRVKGVVAQITYANGKVPSGVILVDSTSSIYVYSNDLAGQAAVGNTVEIAASKAYWILEKEQASAEKHGYKGSNQLENVTVISNDKGNTDFDKSWIADSTIKEILDTPVTKDITNKIFKVNAYVNKVDGSNFVNYYLNDIDGATGNYVYTQCSGADFAWLDEFDGKICTVYVVAMNAKSSDTACFWRFLPVAVSDDGYSFDTTKAGEYAVKYHAVDQFLSTYTGNPALPVITTVSASHLGFEGATLSYSSSDTSVVSFTETDGKLIMNCLNNGTATITITGSYNGVDYSETVEITVQLPDQMEYLTVEEAINADIDSTVTVKGIVGPSVVNKNGFYLFGEDGSVIAVLVNDTAEFAGLEIGHMVILKGTRERYIDDDTKTIAGQTCIVDATIEVNLYGNHEYSTAKFITDKTFADLRNNLDATVDYSTTVFVVEAIINYVDTGYYTSINLKSTDPNFTQTLTLYCSGAGQYGFLVDYAGQTVTLELAACNWNNKNFWAFCALAVYTEDGKTLNTLNFDTY